MDDHLASEARRVGDDQRLRVILAEVCKITSMGFAAVARVTEDRWIVCQVLDKIELGMHPGDELKIMTTICNDIRQCGDMVVIDSIDGNSAWRTHAAPTLYGFQSYVSLPLYTKDGSFFGTLCAIDPMPQEIGGPAIVSALKEYDREVEAILQQV